MENNDSIGLALSGGGYRAATYHIGTFRTLKKLNLLDKIDVISTNSGGSITGSVYSLNHESFEKFEEILLTGVQKSVIRRVIFNPYFFMPFLLIFCLIITSCILLFSGLAWLNLIIWPLFLTMIVFFQFRIFPISKIIEKIYDDIFFNHKKLSDLSKDFKTTINSTNLETGRIFYFSSQKMSDSKYEYRNSSDKIHFKHSSFPISRAVMASSCVPFAFTPVSINKSFYKDQDHFNEIRPRLVDGGVYDNQGIHKLTFTNSSSFCKNVIISDAGTELPFKNRFNNLIQLLIRTSDVFMTRIKNFQMMKNLYRKPSDSDSNVAYQSLGFNVKDSVAEFMKMLKDGYISNQVIEGHEIPKSWIEEKKWLDIETHISNQINLSKLVNQSCTDEELRTARAVSTNLIPLNKNQSTALIKHAETLTEIQVKLYLPHILKR